MSKTKNCIPEKAFSYINAIIAFNEIDAFGFDLNKKYKPREKKKR